VGFCLTDFSRQSRDSPELPRTPWRGLEQGQAEAERSAEGKNRRNTTIHRKGDTTSISRALPQALRPGSRFSLASDRCCAGRTIHWRTVVALTIASVGAVKERAAGRMLGHQLLGEAWARPSASGDAA